MEKVKIKSVQGNGHFDDDLEAIAEYFKIKHGLVLNSQDLDHIELTFRIIRARTISEVLQNKLND